MGSNAAPDMIQSSLVKIRILVVDDDSICLNVVSGMLIGLKHEVVRANHGIDALTTLRRRLGKVDLVVTDYHMPYMDGLELQERVHDEFALPVIVMSADDRDYVMLRCLERGAMFFMVKPIHPYELKNVWQYAVKGRKGKAVFLQGVARPIAGDGPPRPADAGPIDHHYHLHHQQQGATSSALSSNNLIITDRSHYNSNPHHPNILGKKQCQESGKKREQDKAQTSGEKQKKKPYLTAAPRKKKVMWTAALHHRFMQAVRAIGPERVVPKKVLDLMKVPGLRRQNVASHLQKYRLFLKEAAENAYRSQVSASPMGLPIMIANDPDITEGDVDITNPRPLSALQPDYRSFSTQDYYWSHHACLFPGKKPLSASIVSKYASHGRPIAPLLKTNNRQASWKKPVTTETGTGSHCGIYQPDSAFTSAPMNHQTNGTANKNPRNPISFSSGYSSSQSLGNSRQMYQQQQSLLAPKRFASRLLGYGQAASGMSNIDSIIGGTGSFANCLAPPLPSRPNGNNNSAGIRLTGNGDSLGIGQTQHDSAAAAAEYSGTYAGFAAMSGTTCIRNSTLTRPCAGNSTLTAGPGTFCGNCFTPGESSTSTFWIGSPSEGFPGAGDQGPDAPIEVENPFAIEELIKTVLGETDGSPNHPIPGEGSLKSFPSENTNYQSALPKQAHGRNAILREVSNALYQVEVNATQGNEVVNSKGCHSYSSGGNSSAWNEPSPGQYLSFHGEPKDEEIAYLFADFFPVFDENLNKVKSISVGRGSGSNFNAATNNTMQSMGNLTANASEEKELIDDFIESLLNEFSEVGPSQ